MKKAVFLPSALFGFLALLLIQVFWTEQFQNRSIQVSLLAMAWGAHIVTAYLRGTTIWMGAVALTNTEGAEGAGAGRLFAMLIGLGIYIYFGVDIINFYI